MYYQINEKHLGLNFNTKSITSHVAVRILTKIYRFKLLPTKKKTQTVQIPSSLKIKSPNNSTQNLYHKHIFWKLSGFKTTDFVLLPTHLFWTRVSSTALYHLTSKHFIRKIICMFLPQRKFVLGIAKRKPRGWRWRKLFQFFYYIVNSWRLNITNYRQTFPYKIKLVRIWSYL